ncbi:MAG: carbamoyltransferase HypF [Candidatus Cloacimonadota bacterium]|nr:MAG: carbamoyltransferase HypF [Candidatus Cloacimonadota bacterium]
MTGKKTFTQRRLRYRKMKKIRINGIVQGVGFRPFVYKLAIEEKLQGFVLNDTNGVKIEIEGNLQAIERFEKRIKLEAPPAALIDYYKSEQFPDAGYTEFNIKLSAKTDGSTRISPDLAVCNDCMNEFNDPGDPRYQYAFINCTNCGPRYSIIQETPYDRPVTSMKSFAMCEYCESEYKDPLNRRFHAQPIACPVCGPQLSFFDHEMNPVPGDPIDNCNNNLKSGKIVGIKGIGGFHIACDATNSKVINELRSRKNRPDKPFAVMVHLNAIKQIVNVSDEQIELLKSAAAPILILPKKVKSPLASNVAPNNPNIGVFLPYAPHHFQIVTEQLPFVIMTSGNMRDEPIAIDKKVLSGLCDCFLSHNRPILNRSDDSIILPADQKNIVLRRSRGIVPSQMKLPFNIIPTMGTGAELKLSFAITKNEDLYLSPYLGNSGSKETMDFYKETLTKYKKWFRLEPELIACDLQPDFATTRFAEQSKLPIVKVQHHHAHVAAIMAEHQLNEKVIGISFDGTGFGTDKNIWGGEILIADYDNFERAYHLEYMPLPSGDAAIKHPIRIAFAYLKAAGINPDFLTGISEIEQKIITKQLENNFNIFQTSSMGRLFDCVAAMLNLYPAITFEAQSAMALEFLCNYESILNEKSYSFKIENGKIKIFQMLNEIVADIKSNIPHKTIAKRFHKTILDFTLEALIKIRAESGLNKIVLSGGVMQNKIILCGLDEILSKNDFEVFLPERIPPNDGSIAVGQVMVANKKYKKENE